MRSKLTIGSATIVVIAKPTKSGEAIHLHLYLQGFMDSSLCLE
ncbi:MAG: hypothetical protein SNJ55_08205 [Chloroherpetonaceae bacterium]